MSETFLFAYHSEFTALFGIFPLHALPVIFRNQRRNRRGAAVIAHVCFLISVKITSHVSIIVFFAQKSIVCKKNGKFHMQEIEIRNSKEPERWYNKDMHKEG